MENCALQLAGDERAEPITSAASPSSPTDEASHFSIEECLSLLEAISLGDPSGVRSSPEPKSEYFSARVELMVQSEEHFPSIVARDIAHSKVHWSQVRHRPYLSDDTDCDTDPVNVEYEAEVSRENEQVFEELLNDPQWNHPELGSFFRDWKSGVRLGRKIAEGGQAKIFEFFVGEDLEADFLLKVFKRGSRLSDLRRQWPHGVLRRDALCITGWGMMLDDGRFAFGVLKCWGDLRKVIDQAMRERNNKGPPFPYHWNGETWEAGLLLWEIASQMKSLHGGGILHRDLKAANIMLNSDLLITRVPYYPVPYYPVVVADFECSIGVMGTTFWRAPEILAAIKNRSGIEFSKEADVYSYGMICFEVVTGRLPFEGELKVCQLSYDLVIQGQRLKLPSDLDATLKRLIERCWDPIPSARPTFSEICEALDDEFVNICA